MNSLCIPEALKARNEWLAWRYEARDGKETKVPIDAKNGRYGQSNNPRTWAAFDVAWTALQNGKGYDGIGFAFSEGDGLTGIDVDHPWNSPIAVKIREQFQGTYCEKSPRGKLRIFCYGKPHRCGKGTDDKSIELYNYSSPRYLTVTGDWIRHTGAQVTDQQGALDWLHETYFKPKEKPEARPKSQAHVSLSVSDQEVIDRAKDARNGGKFSTLFYGGEAAGYPSQSEADAALCSMLAFWTQDAGQIDRIFRQSALMREKWDKRHHADGRTYGMMTIERALGAVTETYRAGFTEEGPSPWEDPPVESYADDPENQGQGPEGAETRQAEETILDIGKAVLSFADLLKAAIPERKRILPWLPEGGLCMVYSPRGLGKTFFGLGLAHALTSGTPFMKWEDIFGVGVLYIDGEMPLCETRERLQGFIFKNPTAPLEVLSHEMFYRQFEKDLVVTDPDVQHALLELLDAKKALRVVILDNLSSASRLREDKADDWRNCFLPFLIACRRRGVAVVLIHHTGKGGDQRGTGAREDHLDTSIKLSKPDDHTSEGCHFRVDFTKARSCYGETVGPFTAQLIKGSDGAYTWAIATIEESTKERLIEIIADCGEKGISVGEAASELDVAHSLISKLKRDLIAEKVIQDQQVRKAKMIIAANWEGKK